MAGGGHESPLDLDLCEPSARKPEDSHWRALRPGPATRPSD